MKNLKKRIEKFVWNDIGKFCIYFLKKANPNSQIGLIVSLDFLSVFIQNLYGSEI